VSTVALIAGVTLLVVGAVFAVALGPSGRVEASSRIASPGVVVLDKNALRASSAPVQVSARSGSGQVTAVRMLDDDALAALDGSRHTLIDGVSFLPRALQATERRDGPLPHAFNADTFLAPPVTGEQVTMDIVPSRLPQALVVFPGTVSDPRDDAVDVTMSWANAAWCWQAVALALAGLGLLISGMLGRRRRPRPAPGHDAPGHDAPGHDAPGHDAPGHDAPGHDARVHDAPVHPAPEEEAR
jgi:hypothetical protein